ncbi:MAG: L-lactate dehydrogenase [Lachnospiraceae bacterium]|nr:L-lactate dehydrogenase [Lachnospiraceae bacterium]
MAINPRKAAIIGLGNVGASIAFALMQKDIYSELVLIDYNTDKSEGEAMDLSNGLPYTGAMHIHAGDYSDVGDAGIIIITAGTARKQGESRLDLINRNSAILRSVIDPIKASGFEGILLIVSNPMDILTHLAVEMSGYPENRVIGSGTVLDTARLKDELSQLLSVDARNVHTMIIGEHGDSEVPLWSITNIAGVPLAEFCRIRGYEGDQSETLQEIYENVRDSGSKIISKKGATYYGIAMAVSRICTCISKNEHAVLTVSVPLHGEYGLEGVHLGLPTILGSSGIEKVLTIKLSDEEHEKLIASGEALKKVIEEL